MFKKILVPLDGSGRAEQALPVAARLARASSGSLLLVRVVSTAMQHYPSAPAKPVLDQTAGDADRTLAESYLEGIASLPLYRDVAIKTEVHIGLVAPTILSIAASEQADVIVICSHGFSGVKRWVMGSVAEKVAHNADIPVLVLSEDSPVMTERLANKIRQIRVLVPLDGSEYAQAALAPAAYLGAGLTTQGQGLLCLTHVAMNNQHVSGLARTKFAGQNSQEDVQIARAYLDEMVSNIRDGLVAPEIAELNLSLNSLVAVGDDVALEIIRIAEHGEDTEAPGDDGFDVIAMTTHGHSAECNDGQLEVLPGEYFMQQACHC